jgi:hypothetical protein
VTVLAQFGERIATLGQYRIGALLGLLCRMDCRLDRRDLFARAERFRIGRFRGALRLDPASMEQPRFDRADLVCQLTIAFGRARLPAQRCGALFLFPENFPEPREIGLGRTQLLLGILAAGMQAGDAGCFLEQLPSLDRLGGDDRADPALTDKRGRVRSGGRVGKQERDILGANVAAIDPVGRPGAALDPSGDLAFASFSFFAGELLKQDGHFSEISRWTRCSSGEDHIVHAAAAQ